MTVQYKGTPWRAGWIGVSWWKAPRGMSFHFGLGRCVVTARLGQRR